MIIYYDSKLDNVNNACLNKKLLEIARDNGIETYKINIPEPYSFYAPTRFSNGEYVENFNFKKLGVTHSDFTLLCTNKIQVFENNKHLKNIIFRDMYSLCNKNNKIYSKEEWVSIFQMVNSQDIQTVCVVLALLKNVDNSQNILGSMVYTVIRDKNNYKDTFDYHDNKVFFELFYKQYLNGYLNDITALTTAIKYASIEERNIINDPWIIGFYIDKYKHWLSFGEIKIKEERLVDKNI